MNSVELGQKRRSRKTTKVYFFVESTVDVVDRTIGRKHAICNYTIDGCFNSI